MKYTNVTNFLFFCFLLLICPVFLNYQLIDNSNNKTQVSFVNTSNRFSKDEIPSVPINLQWKPTAWKGEKIHQQILVWSDKSIPVIRIKASSLRNGRGQQIDSKQISTGFIGYVLTDGFGSKESSCKNDREDQHFDSSWVTDPIYPKQELNAQSNKVQPIWVSIEVPDDIAPGTYTGKIEVWAEGKTTLSVTLKVLDKVLPPPSRWSFHLDLWQHPAAIARVEKVPLWSREHFEAMKPYYQMLAKAGQKVITTTIVNEPWGHQTYDDFPSLVKWIKKTNGTWQYDYSLFDRYVEMVMNCGINQQINCYSMIPWKLSFTYFDEASGKDTIITANLGTEKYIQLWRPMLVDFEVHLKSKGWFGKTTITMDERPLKSMQEAISLLKSLDPGWKISLAGNYHPEIEKDIYDYCIASRYQFDSLILKGRKAAGRISTYYTCCVERYPNTFTFSPPDEAVCLGLYAAAKDFDGYLRWAYNSWPKSPLKDSRFPVGPAGDDFLIYPGPISSIRFEKLIEGIQDFEKIQILKNSYLKNNSKKALEKLQKALNEIELDQLKGNQANATVNKMDSLLNTPF